MGRDAVLLLDIVLAAFFMVVGITGMVKFFYLYPLFGFDVYVLTGRLDVAWSRLHDGAGFIFVLLLILHSLTHLRWYIRSIRALFIGEKKPVNENQRSPASRRQNI